MSPHSGGGSRTLLEEDPFIGSSSNGRREHPPALPLLQGASPHEFIARCSLEGRQGAKRGLEGNPKKGFPSKSVRRDWFPRGAGATDDLAPPDRGGHFIYCVCINPWSFPILWGFGFRRMIFFGVCHRIREYEMPTPSSLCRPSGASCLGTQVREHLISNPAKGRRGSLKINACQS